MTRADLTDITVVLDRSGSMQSIKAATIESFNGFLNSQKGGTGTALMSLVQFDDQYEVVYQAKPLDAAPELTDKSFVPRGSTALLDAIGTTINAAGERFAKMPEEERPGLVLMVILTDGLENASRQFTMQQINSMISLQRDTYSWKFIFLGANQDAIATATRMGMSGGQALTMAASPAGVAASLGAVGGHVHAMRKMRASSPAAAPDFAFSDQERETAADKAR